MNLLSIIGKTPLVEICNMSGNSKIKIFGKFEGANPGGSVKDRPAYYMLQKAEESGVLTKEKTILEPTSGNTGIGLAMIAAAKGYKIKLFMPECVSTERQYILAAFGAEVILTPAKEGTDGAIKRAHEMINDKPDKYYMPNQFDNANNALAHYETTGPEIFSQTKGEIDLFVAGMGTTGTIMGAGRYLREQNPKVKIVGIEPELGHTIQGLKNMEESIIPKIYSPEKLDDKIIVSDGEAFEMTRQLATKEGLFVGMSSGAAVAGALKAAKNIDSGVIVIILPDRGDRYLSTTLFRSICGKCPP
ncbi:MAG: cysteine synthase family protein [Thermodesulfobacteriota bacterium]|nr:cysteine synthase family protein [Thermodesulfobacteriota bacterium]